MRIACPYCGERGVDEFVYQGDATIVRPATDAPQALDAFVTYAYERTNGFGTHRELWFHSAGCHALLVVTRNVSTHAIAEVVLAKGVAQRRFLGEVHG